MNNITYMALKANIIDIIRGTTVDGPGFRTSIYFAGCRHECPGCHNPQSWDFNSGRPMSVEEIMEIVREEDFDVTLSGGDPIYHLDFIIPLCREITETGHNVWVYTGFKVEQLIDNPKFRELCRYVDTFIDSPFILDLRDPDLLFRGSSNQRIIKASDLI